MGKNNDLTSVLMIIKNDYPNYLYDDDRLLSVFSDLAPELQREKKILKAFISCDGLSGLKQCREENAPQEIIRQKVKTLLERMYDEDGIAQENAYEICASFGTAIGLRMPTYQQLEMKGAMGNQSNSIIGTNSQITNNNHGDGTTKKMSNVTKALLLILLIAALGMVGHVVYMNRNHEGGTHTPTVSPTEAPTKAPTKAPTTPPTKAPTATPKRSSQNTPSPRSAQPVDIGVPNLQGKSYSHIYSGPNSTYDMNIYVYWVQVQLKQLGYYNGDLSGLFDRTTNSSISSFMSSQNKSYSSTINQNVIDTIDSAIGAKRIVVKYGGFYRAMDYLFANPEQGAGNMSIIWSNINRDKYGSNPNTPYVIGGAFWVQYCLTHLDYNPNGIDGKFGEGTDRAVQRFESDNGFSRKADGHVYVTYGEARRMIEMCYSRGIDISNMDWGD